MSTLTGISTLGGESVRNQESPEQTSGYPLHPMYDVNAFIFSYLDRATQLVTTQVSRDWRVFTINEKQLEQERRVKKVLTFLRTELQTKYPNVVSKCEECLTSDPITAISLQKTDESTSRLRTALAEQLQYVDTADLIRLQGIFQSLEDKPFGFESLFFDARKQRINLQGVNALQGPGQQIPAAIQQQRVADSRQLGLEAVPYFEKLLKLGKIAEAAAFVGCIPYSNGGEEAFEKLDQARAVQIEELIKEGKFDEAISSANKVNHYQGGSCYRLLENIGIAAAYVGDFNAAERVLNALPDEYNRSESGKKIHQGLIKLGAIQQAEEFNKLLDVSIPFYLNR